MGKKAFGAIIAIAAIALAGPLATAIGFGSSGLGFLLARTVIAMGIQALGSSVLGLNKRDGGNGTGVSQSGIMANEASGIAQIPIVYGRRKVGARRIYLNVKDKTYLHMVMAVSEGEIGRIRKVYFNDILAIDMTVGTPGGTQNTETAGVGQVVTGTDSKITEKFRDHLRFEYRLGTETQSAFSYLTGKFAEWDANAKCTGVALVYFEFKFNPDVYNSIPNITLEIDGVKVARVESLSNKYSVAYRSTTDGDITYTEPASPYNNSWGVNPADVVYNYLTNSRYGKGIDTGHINIDSFIDAKRYCKQTVQASFGGTTETYVRYMINGHCEPDDTLYNNIKRILSCFQGYLVFSNGQYYLKLNKEVVDPATDIEYPQGGTDPQVDSTLLNSLYQFNENNMIGKYDVQLASKSNRFNRMKLTYYDERSDYNPSIQYYDSATYLARDNNEIFEREIELPMVTDQRNAMTLAGIILNQSRNQMAINFQAVYSALVVEVGDVVCISIENMGWTQKLFRIMSMGINLDGTIDITATEYQHEAYLLTTLPEITEPGSVTLPDFNSVAAPTGLTTATRVVSASDGSKQVFIDASWTAPTGDGTIKEYEIQVTATGYENYSRTTGTSISFGPLPNGTYTVKVRAVNAYGSYSAYLT
jgi:predicted phage tail protein